MKIIAIGQRTSLWAVVLASFMLSATAGNAQVSFGVSQPFTVGSGPVFCKVADLDGDNAQDVVFVTSEIPPAGLYVTYGKSDGTFEPPALIRSYTGSFQAAVTVDYVNSDPLPDIILVQEPSVRILLAAGARMYTETSFTAGPFIEVVSAVSTGYFNADRYLDVICTDGQLLFGDGAGGLVATGQSLGGSGFDVADFNNDGFDDLVIISSVGLDILANDGNASFSHTGSLPISGGSSFSVTTARGLADFNRDGYPDVATVNYLGSPAIGSKLTVAFGDGAGGFGGYDTSRIAGYALNAVVTDIDRDGNIDIAVSTPDVQRALVMYFGDGLGMFPDSQAFLITPNPGGIWPLGTGDFDRDGNPDFVTAGSYGSGPMTVLYNQLPDAPVLADEMTVEALNISASGSKPAVDVAVINPTGFEISRDVRSVAGSSYGRLDVDASATLDVQTLDYNVQQGTYRFIVTPWPGVPVGTPFTLGIRVDGSMQAVVFKNYSYEFMSLSSGRQGRLIPFDTIKFDFTLEEPSSIQPPNGIATQTRRPWFDWSLLVGSQPPTARYRFQLSLRHVFDQAVEETSDLITANYRRQTSLNADMVYYWRIATAPDGITYGPWLGPFAAYITPTCCLGITGNLDGDASDLTDGSDLQTLVDYVFFSIDLLSDCGEENDVNADGTLDGGDLQVLIDYIFFDLPPVPCPL